MSDTIRRLLIKGASTADIRDQALKEGMVSMMNDGMHKVEEGITTPSEIVRSAYTVEQQL
jgi:general secretion pathway protein E